MEENIVVFAFDNNLFIFQSSVEKNGILINGKVKEKD